MQTEEQEVRSRADVDNHTVNDAEIQNNMDPRQKQLLDDVFDAFHMLAGGNIVSVTHVESGVTRYTPSAVELFQLSGEYIPDGNAEWAELIHPEDRRRYLNTRDALFSGERQNYAYNYRVLTASGDYVNFRSVGSVLHSESGTPELIGGMLVNQGLMDNTDTITVLPNRYAYLNDLRTMMAHGKKPVSLLIGISKLGHINEMHGYSYGNRILQEMAWLIQETVGQRGQVYRMDGACFAFMTDTLSRQQVAAIYDSLRLKLQRGVRIDGMRSILTANGGMLALGDGQFDPPTACACLNFAYRESKMRRHGELVDFNGTYNYDVRASMEMVNTIRDCIVAGCRGFSIAYQPVVDARTDEIIGLEALTRWTGEGYGRVEPMQFIPILEKDFVFEELGAWIMQQVTRDGIELLKYKPDLRVSVNISAAQMEDEYFIDMVTEYLQQSGLPPENLCLELTKDCRLLDMQKLNEIVQALHNLHISVVIDDFGTGFESIGFLKHLAVDYIKIDRRLVKDIEDNEADRQTMIYLARMADIRGTKVIAKGVENAAMHDILMENAVFSMQGNYYSRPIPLNEVIERFFQQP